MSQITIVNNHLNFTEVAAVPVERSSQNESHDYRQEDGRAETRQEEEQRIAHELTSILISGHLPQ